MKGYSLMVKNRKLISVKIRNLLNIITVLACFLIGCAPDEAGLYPAREGAATTMRWQDGFKGDYPQKPFPNDAFLNKSGQIELKAAGNLYSISAELGELRGFSPAAPLLVPFSGPLSTANDWQKAVKLINKNGQLQPVKVQYDADGWQLWLYPERQLAWNETYAVVLTNELKDQGGEAVGSPLPWINHFSQNEQLKDLFEHNYLQPEEVTFLWSFTVRPKAQELQELRDGLYGDGIFKSLENIQLARVRLTDVANDDGATDGGYLLKGLLDSRQIVGTQGNYWEAEYFLELANSLAETPLVDLPYLMVIPHKTKEPYPVAVYLPDTEELAAVSLQKAREISRIKQVAVAYLPLPVSMPGQNNSFLGQRREWWQSVYHLLQLVRTMNNFDCHKYLNFDFNHDGLPELAGDFDSDGQCEIKNGSKVAVYGSGSGLKLAKILAAVESNVIIADDSHTFINWPSWLAAQGRQMSYPLYNQQILDDYDATNY